MICLWPDRPLGTNPLLFVRCAESELLASTNEPNRVNDHVPPNVQAHLLIFRFRRSTWWAGRDLNPRPEDYESWRAQRCAHPHIRRWTWQLRCPNPLLFDQGFEPSTVDAPGEARFDTFTQLHGSFVHLLSLPVLIQS